MKGWQELCWHNGSTYNVYWHTSASLCECLPQGDKADSGGGLSTHPRCPYLTAPHSLYKLPSWNEGACYGTSQGSIIYVGFGTSGHRAITYSNTQSSVAIGDRQAGEV